MDWTVFRIFFISALLKALMIPLYYSTDFDVHRNWLSITHNLPFAKWYVDATSQWTLDYPPFFAFFEYILSFAAQMVDPKMLVLQESPYYSMSCVIFQRLSVILISDAVLLTGALSLTRESVEGKWRVAIAVLFCPALIIVDHIHFQYNGLLLGLLMHSCSWISNGRPYAGSALYMVLVFMKHIYLYCAPVLFIYLLVRHVLPAKSRAIAFSRFSALGASVMSITAIALYPLYGTDQIGQAMSRMFPFGRGLTHAYWAPNVWALYTGIDRVLGKVLQVKLPAGEVGATSGLVEVTRMLVLPQVTPVTCFALTSLVFLPVCVQLWDRKNDIPLIAWCALGNWVAFMVGWHVHEKAVLMFSLPLFASALASNWGTKYDLQRQLLDLRIIAAVSVIPLIPSGLETSVVWLIVIGGGLMDRFLMGNDKVLLPGLGAIFSIISGLYYSFIHGKVTFAGGSWPFLPLVIMSIVCTGSILQLFWDVLFRVKFSRKVKL